MAITVRPIREKVFSARNRTRKVRHEMSNRDLLRSGSTRPRSYNDAYDGEDVPPPTSTAAPVSRASSRRLSTRHSESNFSAKVRRERLASRSALAKRESVYSVQLNDSNSGTSEVSAQEDSVSS